jgi:hypothetical protein
VPGYSQQEYKKQQYSTVQNKQNNMSNNKKQSEENRPAKAFYILAEAITEEFIYKLHSQQRNI